MGRKIKYVAVCLSFLMLAPFSTATFGARGPKAKNLRAGAVYVLTNQPNNTVAAFRRNAKGVLTPAGQFPTGGAADPVPQGTDPATDPLASQGSLIISHGNRFLIAVNAGSNQISVLKIKKNELQLVDVVNSGGIRPISLALHEDLLYVLNEGGIGHLGTVIRPALGVLAPPNITGFTVEEDGTLTPLPGSTQPLIGGVAADPAQIGFSHDGELLVVTEKDGNRLNIYTIDDNGLQSAPINNPSNGMTPFGFAFNNADTLVVSEAFGGAPSQSAVSSYTVSDSGLPHSLTVAARPMPWSPDIIDPVSVISGSVPNSQTASCWVVITNNGKFGFVSNTASGTISSYRINAENGSLTLLNPVAASMGMGSAPIDMTLSVNSRFLFVLLGGTQSVASFRISGGNGSLTPVDTASGLPFGAQGIAAK